MALNIEPPPTDTPVVERSGLMQKKWLDWLVLVFLARVLTSAFTRATAPLTTDQHAAIGATSLVPLTNAGVYRVTAYGQVRVVDGVSSSFRVSLQYTNLGQNITRNGTLVNGDTLTSIGDDEWRFRADPNTLISYSVAYASNTPAKMQYRLDVIAEQLS